MKKALLIIVLLWTNKTIACECVCHFGDLFNIFNKYEAIFIGKVIIQHDLIKKQVSSYPTSKELNDTLNGKTLSKKEILIDIKKIYKGKPSTSLIIKPSGCCGRLAPKPNTEWIFFTSKNSEGKFDISECNPSKDLKNYPFLDQQLKIVIKKRRKKWNTPILIKQRKKYLITSLKTVNPKSVKNDFGFYLIEFNTDKSINKIKTLNSLGKEADKIIKDFYRNLEYWNYQDRKKRNMSFEPNTITSIIIYKDEFIE